MGVGALLRYCFGDQAEQGVVHVLVELPADALPPEIGDILQTPAPGFRIPTTTKVLEESAASKKEIEGMERWKPGSVHDIPTISSFMGTFGGCTDGKIYWRQEEKQVFGLLLEALVGKELESIVHGSRGVGKSTLLCLAML